MNFHWEKAVIGTALFDPDTVSEAEYLIPSDFNGSHQDVWTEILILHRSDSLDIRSVVESMRDAGTLSGLASFDTTATGEGYVKELLEAKGSQMELYAQKVFERSVKHQLALSAGLIRADAEDQNISADEALDNAERRLVSLRRDRMAEEGVTLGDILAVFMPKLHGMLDGSYEPAWVPHLLAIKQAIDYAEEEDLIIGAARPGDGKSSIMKFEAYQSGLKGTPVCLFNLENSHADYARGMLALDSGVDSRKMKDPRRLSEEELKSIRESADKLFSLPIHIVTLGAPSIIEIERIARRKISSNNVKWIGIDYIQLVRNGFSNRVDDVTASSGGARAMALRYKVPVFVNAQLSRKIVYRGEDAEPDLSDLRESGSLEQDATIVMMYRRKWYSPTNDQLRLFPGNVDEDGHLLRRPNDIPLNIWVKKHRNGVTGLAEPVLWTLPTGNLRTLDRYSLPESF